MRLTFDTTIPFLVESLSTIVNLESFSNGDILIIRDYIGQITLLLRNNNLLEYRSQILEKMMELKPHVSEDPVVTIDELFDEGLRQLEIGYVIKVETPSNNNISVRILDRRIVGADWQRYPLEKVNSTPVIVFWSIKGGVGRSTALCIGAANLARKGLNILAIDLDLEAPGIGGMLLNNKDRPQFGVLDYFVELGKGEVSDEIMQAMIAPSRLTLGGGLISVVPAVGTLTEKNPESMLAKIARAYIDKEVAGEILSFMDQVRLLINKLSQNSIYDAIFIDARAGLNESTAASILGVGGNVLMFGIDTPQTFDDYRFFMAHINRFTSNKDSKNWRSRLQMVHAKASSLEKQRMKWREKSFDLFSDWIYDEADHDNIDAFNFDIDDSDAPHYGWPILHDGSFIEFDPLSSPEQLSEEISVRTFGNFTDRLGNLIRTLHENVT